MIGFCLAIPGIKAPEKIYLHSHIWILKNLAIQVWGHVETRAARHAIRRRLTDRMDFPLPDTFSKSERHFNIERLGAIVRRSCFNQ